MSSSTRPLSGQLKDVTEKHHCRKYACCQENTTDYTRRHSGPVQPAEGSDRQVTRRQDPGARATPWSAAAQDAGWKLQIFPPLLEMQQPLKLQFLKEQALARQQGRVPPTKVSVPLLDSIQPIRNTETLSVICEKDELKKEDPEIVDLDDSDEETSDDMDSADSGLETVNDFLEPGVSFQITSVCSLSKEEAPHDIEPTENIDILPDVPSTVAFKLDHEGEEESTILVPDEPHELLTVPDEEASVPASFPTEPGGKSPPKIINIEEDNVLPKATFSKEVKAPPQVLNEGGNVLSEVSVRAEDTTDDGNAPPKDTTEDGNAQPKDPTEDANMQPEGPTVKVESNVPPRIRAKVNTAMEKMFGKQSSLGPRQTIARQNTIKANLTVNPVSSSSQKARDAPANPKKRPWRCPVCQATFRVRSTLTKHMGLLHFKSRLLALVSETSPFVCPRSNCKERFASREAVVQHLVEGHEDLLLHYARKVSSRTGSVASAHVLLDGVKVPVVWDAAGNGVIHRPDGTRLRLKKTQGERVPLSFEDVLKIAIESANQSYNTIDGRFNSNEILNIMDNEVHDGFLHTTNRKSYHEAVCLMVLNLLFPQLHDKLQECTAMPLSGFKSVQHIRDYIDEVNKYGLSSMSNRGAIYVLGNTNAGKTSLVNTLKNFIHNPDQNPSFQTENEESLQETEVAQVYSNIGNIRAKSVQHKIPKVELIQENVIIFEEVENEIDQVEDFTFTCFDFGGQGEYFVASQLLIGTAGTFLLCFDTSDMCFDSTGRIKEEEEIRKEYYSYIGTFIDMIVQKAMKTKMQPKIALVATKCDEPSRSSELKQVFKVVLNLAKEQLNLMDSEKSKVFLVGEVLETTTSESMAHSTMTDLHNKIAALLNCPQLQSHLNLDIPPTYFWFLDNMRKFQSPQVKRDEATKEYEKVQKESKIDFKMKKEDQLILSKLKEDIVDKIKEDASPESLEPVDESTSQTLSETLTQSILDNNNDDKLAVDNNDDKLEVSPKMAQDLHHKVETILTVLCCLGEIIYFQDVESLKDTIIPKPMDLVISLRSILNHNLIKRLGHDADNLDCIEDLTTKGIVSHSDFIKISNAKEKTPFTDQQTLDFLKNLDLACTIGCDSNEMMIFIPCLIKDKNEKVFNDYENQMIGDANSICLQYIYNNNTANLGVYNKVLQLCAQHFFLRDSDRITRSYSQKIENRQLGSVGGMHGRLKHREENYDFIVVEYETDFSPDCPWDSSKVGSIARHRGIRFHLNSRCNSNVSDSDREEILQKIDKLVDEVAVPSQRKLVCKKCLKAREPRPGFFKIRKEIKLNIDADCSHCLTPYEQTKQQPRVKRIGSKNTETKCKKRKTVHHHQIGDVYQAQNIIVNNNYSIFSGNTKEEEESYKKLLGIENASNEEVQETLQSLTRLQLSTAKSHLPKVSKLTQSNCFIRKNIPNKGPDTSTGFLVTSPNGIGAILFSAGHNFFDKVQKVPVQQFDDFELFFNNISGYIDQKQFALVDKHKEVPPIYKKISDFTSNFSYTIVVTCKGQQYIEENKNGQKVQKPVQKLSGNEALFDYFALVLHNPDAPKKLKEDHHLELLACATPPHLAPTIPACTHSNSSQSISPQTSSAKKCSQCPEGGAVLTIGHPGSGLVESIQPQTTCINLVVPMRLSYGREIGSNCQQIIYDLDTKGGNSGSPVLGEKYAVKAIHVQGSKQGNRGQCLEPVIKDLEKNGVI